MTRLLLLFFAVWLGMQPSPGYAKKGEFARPPYVGAYEPQGVDERGLWMEIDELERTLRDSPVVLRDQQLDNFLRSVLCKTVGFDRCGATRIYVINDAETNAGMYPNGLMVVNTGFLARLHSEAELATILGHEFAHFELRHQLNNFRKRRTGTDIVMWAALAGAVANQDVSAIQHSAVAEVIRFGRSQETDADLLAAAYIRGSPYNLRASQVWKRLLEEDDAHRKERRLSRIKRYYPSLTDTHPTDLQRLVYFAKLEKEAIDAGEEGEDGAESYRAATTPVLPKLFDTMVKGNAFASADYVIRSRGDALGWDGQMLTLRAELYRLRANPRDIATAREFFQKATTYPDAPPESWRGLGITTLRLGETDAGRSALAEYLKRLPDAKDAAAIKLLLEN